MRTLKRIDLFTARRELAKRSLYHFLLEFWEVISPDVYSDSLHIKYICDEVQTVAERVFRRAAKKYDLVINIPPGTSKTTIVTVMLPVWCWINDPSLVIMTGSYSADLAKEKAGKSKDIINSDKFRRFFPKLKLRADKNNKTLYENSDKGQRIVTSVGGTSTGLHAHLIIVDDPISAKQGFSDAEQLTASNWLDNTLSTRMVDKSVTPLILIMQRLSQKDPTAHLTSKHDMRLKHICLPAEESDDVKPPEARAIYTDGLLDPKRISRSVLADMLSRLGEYGFAGQMQQRPTPIGGGMIRAQWFGIITAEEFARVPPVPPVWHFYVDGAYSEKTNNDPTGILACCFIKGNLYIRCSESNMVTSAHLADYVEAFARKHGYTPRSIIKAEPKSVGMALINEIKRDKALNVKAYSFPEDSGLSIQDSKIVKTCAGIPYINSGRVFLINDGVNNWITDFISEVTSFPNGQHDDKLDCLTFAVQDAIAAANKKTDGLGTAMW